METTFLTPEEVQTLTGLKSSVRQVRWLRAKGWRFELNAIQRPIIARSYAERMLGCGPDFSSSARPNFSALRTVQWGRRRQSNFDDPPRFHKKGKTWYHVTGTQPRVWTKLSADRAEALRMWAMREGVREDDQPSCFRSS